jgi:hypothetical protein
MVEGANETIQTTGIRCVSTLEVPTTNKKQKESRGRQTARGGAHAQRTRALAMAQNVKLASGSMIKSCNHPEPKHVNISQCVTQSTALVETNFSEFCFYGLLTFQYIGIRRTLQHALNVSLLPCLLP